MNCRDYNEKDLLNKKYAILEYSVEDCMYYIVSLHDDYIKAKKRLEHLNREARRLFDKGIDSVGYELHETNSLKIRKCFNYERGDYYEK